LRASGRSSVTVATPSSIASRTGAAACGALIRPRSPR
jgi:hypothetical protein